MEQRLRQRCENPTPPNARTVLLLESDRSLLVDVDLLRANELIVYHCHELANALKQFQHTAPDVVVAVLSGHYSPSIVPGLRGLADYATSLLSRQFPKSAKQHARQALTRSC